MTAQEYLISELENCAQYTLTDADKELLDKQGTQNFIYTKLTSKKFRKWAVDESSETQAKRAIELNVAKNKPMQFRYPFGGYKLWSIPGAPQVNWAEFLAIAYYCRYLAPIAAAYKPGVELLFTSDDVIIERMDNVPTTDTDAYFSSFKGLVAAFGKHLPGNFTLDIVRVADLYPDKDEMEKELAASVEQTKKVYAENANPERTKAMLASSVLNIQWDGAKDLTKLSDSEKQKIIDMGPVYHDGYMLLSRRKEFNRGEDKIVIFTMTIPNAIAIGTTKSSVTKFWTGYGVLEKRGDTFAAKVLAPTQVEILKSESEKVALPGLAGKNFQSIRTM